MMMPGLQPRFAHALLALVTISLPAAAAEPGPARSLRLHPENPHYFLFRGKPAVLITSGEHYGAVLNLDFEYVRYLDELQRHGFNLTRTFSGSYREVPGSFGIPGNTLSPAPGRFRCPWGRGSTPGAADGGNKFDLKTWDAAYLARLKDFVAQAGRRGIVVELVLFCTMYDDSVWNVSPMNGRNNLNGVGNVDRHEVYGLKDAGLTAVQEGLARKLVTELKDFDNVYFELCNEPYERGGMSPDWNGRIIDAIVGAEKDLPADRRHLIAQGIAPLTRIKDPNPHVSVFNFHAAAPENVTLNYALGKAIGDDETGGKGQADLPYRAEAWEFMLAGGSVLSHLDFSFTVEHPDGTAPVTTHPGGGGPKIRRQLAVLKQFIEGFDFLRLKPDDAVVKGGRHAGKKPTVRALAQRGKAYAVYVNGEGQADLVLDLPAGAYRAEWVDTKTGDAKKSEEFKHPGGDKTLAAPTYSEDVALRVRHTGN